MSNHDYFASEARLPDPGHALMLRFIAGQTVPMPGGFVGPSEDRGRRGYAVCQGGFIGRYLNPATAARRSIEIFGYPAIAAALAALPAPNWVMLTHEAYVLASALYFKMHAEGRTLSEEDICAGAGVRIALAYRRATDRYYRRLWGGKEFYGPP